MVETNRRSFSRHTKTVATAVAAIAALLSVLTVVSGVGLMKAGTDKWGCVIGGGLFDTHEVKELVAPGQRGATRLFDSMVEIPASARYYDISANPDIRDFGGEPKATPASGRIFVVPEVQVGFKINENACDLWATYLKRRGTSHFDDGQTGGWAKFLADKMRKSIDKAIVPVFQDQDWSDLYYNPSEDASGQLWRQLETRISKNLSDELMRTLGAEYFCGTSYKYDGKADSKFTCPDLVVSIQKVLPENMNLITNKETIKDNQEAAMVIESAKVKAIAQADADKEVAINAAENREQKAIAEGRANRAEAVAAEARAQNDMAPCLAVKATGTECALLMAVLRGVALPQVLNSNATPTVTIK